MRLLSIVDSHDPSLVYLLSGPAQSWVMSHLGLATAVQELLLGVALGEDVEQVRVDRPEVVEGLPGGSG